MVVVSLIASQIGIKLTALVSSDPRRSRCDVCCVLSPRLVRRQPTLFGKYLTYCFICLGYNTGTLAHFIICLTFPQRTMLTVEVFLATPRRRCRTKNAHQFAENCGVAAVCTTSGGLRHASSLHGQADSGG